VAEPPVTITTSRVGATARCHLCPWEAHAAQSLLGTLGGRSAVERISDAWADHWRTAHIGSPKAVR
jgi:hypothetical protein